ncbi:MAG: hypothetical protein JWN01_746 [Patescibacteria group bacterium]|nr:hypothetical protein [Patescibacteria group bacterium]
MSWLSRLAGKEEPAAEITSALDLVIYAAGLASSSQAIDTTLQKVRLITAQVQPGGPMPAAVEAPLLQAYLDIEQYLIYNEPLRSFTKEDLRRRLSETLRSALAKHEAPSRS